MKPRIEHVIAWAVEILLIALLPLALYHGAHLQAFAAGLAILISFLPAIAKRNYRITLPWTFELLIILALYLHMGGLVFGWYGKYAWWDVMTHLLGSAVTAMLGFLLVFSLYRAGKIHLTIPMMAVFTFFFAMAIGGLWEVAEFGADRAFGTHNQPSLADTDFDLINDGLAAILVAILGSEYVRRLPEAAIERNLERLIRRVQEK
ncbi:MAG TPA: hypothetical protein VLJ21_02405 [Candidatus Binatia bacterium]|nr:hypothetical protein [Candidatus Binatia bacterium]